MVGKNVTKAQLAAIRRLGFRSFGQLNANFLHNMHFPVSEYATIIDLYAANFKGVLQLSCKPLMRALRHTPVIR